MSAPNLRIVRAGEGASETQVVHLDDWSFTRFTGRQDDEPRLSDVDLCKRVGYKNIRRLRHRIRELHSQDPENFNPLAVCSGSEQTSGGRPGTKFYLTEHEALFLISQINTEIARKLTHEMIRVYIAVRRGLRYASTRDDQEFQSQRYEDQEVRQGRVLVAVKDRKRSSKQSYARIASTDTGGAKLEPYRHWGGAEYGNRDSRRSSGYSSAQSTCARGVFSSKDRGENYFVEPKKLSTNNIDSANTSVSIALVNSGGPYAFLVCRGFFVPSDWCATTARQSVR